MTDKKQKRRKLSYEILGMFAVCFVLSLLLFLFLSHVTVAIVEDYCFNNDIYLDDDRLYQLDSTVLSVSFAVSGIFFGALFLAIFADRLSYIKAITDGVNRLQRGEYGKKVPVKGKNELTQLADAVNYLSESEQRIKKKEKRLNDEKEELIRTLSHDIRTPLTSIMSYTEILSGEESLTPDQINEYLSLVRKKTEQIKGLTDILLDGGKRNVEYFSDAKLLTEQLAGEFDEMLEDEFKLCTDLSGVSAFAGHFDVNELRRIFDNLASNIKKYADKEARVELSVSNGDGSLVIKQSNSVRENSENTESYRMGINSIRRIAHNYGGSVELECDTERFEIIITLSYN